MKVVALVAALGGCEASSRVASEDPACDADGDGYPSMACGGSDCDDERADVHPAALDVDLAGWIDEDLAVGDWWSFPRIVVDPLEGVHVVASSYTRHSLAHFERRAGEWAADRADGGFEVVGAYSDWGYWRPTPTPLAADAEGAVHVAFADAAGTLHHVVGSGEAWESEIVAPGGAVAPSIAVGESVEVAWIDPANALVHEASMASGEWLETGSWPITTASDTSTAVDPTDPSIVHLGWIDGVDLHHAVRRDGVWTDSIVETDEPPTGCALAVGPSAAPHFACVEDGWLVHYSGGDEGWTRESLGQRVQYEPSLAIGSTTEGEEALHVTFQVEWSTHVAHATRTSGDWTFETMSQITGGGYGFDMAVDGQGDAHLVHLGSDGILRHTWFARPDEVDQDCDGTSA